MNPNTFRLARRVEQVNILAHPEKRFYNSAIPSNGDTEVTQRSVFSQLGASVCQLSVVRGEANITLLQRTTDNGQYCTVVKSKHPLCSVVIFCCLTDLGEKDE